MSDLRAVSRWRTLPFNEHRTWAEVVETEQLEARLARRELISGGEARHLQRLQSRATLPDSMLPGPDAAA